MSVLRKFLIRGISDLVPEERAMYGSYENRVFNLIGHMENFVQVEWSFPIVMFHNLIRENLVIKNLYDFYRILLMQHLIINIMQLVEAHFVEKYLWKVTIHLVKGRRENGKQYFNRIKQHLK